MVRPRILSPKKILFIHYEVMGQIQKNIPFYAIVDGNVRRLKWYVDSNSSAKAIQVSHLYGWLHEDLTPLK